MRDEPDLLQSLYGISSTVDGRVSRVIDPDVTELQVKGQSYSKWHSIHFSLTVLTSLAQPANDRRWYRD